MSPSNAIANGNRAADSASNEDVYSSSCNEEAPEDDEANKPVISRQGTFSKEGEREDGDEDTVPRTRYVIMVRGRSLCVYVCVLCFAPISRFVELEREMTAQASAMAEVCSELEALQNDKEMLLLRNKSLEEELQKEKQLLAMLHKHHATFLHHVHRHDMTCPHHHAWWLIDKSNYEVGSY